jgi:hypothetical protein
MKSPPTDELEEEEIDEDGGAGVPPAEEGGAGVPPAEEIDEDGGAGVSPAEDGGAGVSPAAEVPPAEEIEVYVKRFEHNGKKWLRDANGVIYDLESQEEVGVWNEEKKCIEMLV